MFENCGKNSGLVDRVQVEVLSGHSYRGLVPLWQNNVPRPEEGVQETCGVDPFVSSGVKEPRPDVEAVVAELILWRSSSSSAFCVLTRFSSLRKQMK